MKTKDPQSPKVLDVDVDISGNDSSTSSQENSGPSPHLPKKRPMRNDVNSNVGSDHESEKIVTKGQNDAKEMEKDKSKLDLMTESVVETDSEEVDTLSQSKRAKLDLDPDGDESLSCCDNNIVIQSHGSVSVSLVNTTPSPKVPFLQGINCAQSTDSDSESDALNIPSNSPAPTKDGGCGLVGAPSQDKQVVHTEAGYDEDDEEFYEQCSTCLVYFDDREHYADHFCIPCYS